MSGRLEIDVLRALKAVHDMGGVTRAAKELSLSQSAVSHKIRRLEQSIDCQLLSRQPGQFLLTEDGQRLLEFAERIITIHDEALAGVRKRVLKGRIKLGITEELVTRKLSTVLGRFSRLYPDVHVKTQVEQSLTLKDRLKKGSIDMAVMQVFTRELENKDESLHEDGLVWVKSVDYEVPVNQPVPFVSFDQNCFYRKWAIEKFLESNKKLDVVLECASNEGVCNAVLAGIGTALIAERNIQAGMEHADVGLERPPNISFVVRTSADQPSPPVQVLCKEITQTLSG